MKDRRRFRGQRWQHLAGMTTGEIVGNVSLGFGFDDPRSKER